MGIQLSECIENIVGKGEIARNEQFLLFPQCFKTCLLLMSQNEYLWSKGLTRAPNAGDITQLQLYGYLRKFWVKKGT